jgi:citronellol/citronellal dehydrogenase
MKRTLAGKTVFITGASRGIGREMALRFARDGARIVIAAKTTEPHPKLPGTIYSVAAEVEAAGGAALPVVMDVRDDAAVEAAVAAAVDRFGGIDVLVNNASATGAAGLLETPVKRADLVMAINARGTYLCNRAAVPHLLRAENPHILTLSPPLSLSSFWLGKFPVYALSKYGMTMLTLAVAEEFRLDGVAANTLWPRTLIATEAVRFMRPENYHRSRIPAIMADAAYSIVTSSSREVSGRSFLDEDRLRDDGVADFLPYSTTPGVEPMVDMLIDEPASFAAFPPRRSAAAG